MDRFRLLNRCLEVGGWKAALKVAPIEALDLVVILPWMRSPRYLCATSHDVRAYILLSDDVPMDVVTDVPAFLMCLHFIEFADMNSTRRRVHKPVSMIIDCRFEGMRRYLRGATVIARYHFPVAALRRPLASLAVRL
jgi:hypothetical protein